MMFNEKEINREEFEDRISSNREKKEGKTGENIYVKIPLRRKFEEFPLPIPQF